MNKTFANYRKVNPPMKSADVGLNDRRLTRENLAALQVENSLTRKPTVPSPPRASAVKGRKESKEGKASKDARETRQKLNLSHLKQRIRGLTQSPRLHSEGVTGRR